uniref:C2H2-type domain-containing protein n=1 Tax=Elaeophora elaphi TaxID=1147741 RepID=A0A0R3RP07_9BILA
MFKCVLCGKGFVWENLKQHNLTHAKNRLYKCDDNPKTHKLSHANVKCMNETEDTINLNLSKDIRKYKFNRIDTLKNHKLLYANNRCDVYGKGFKQNSSLLRDTRIFN